MNASNPAHVLVYRRLGLIWALVMVLLVGILAAGLVFMRSDFLNKGEDLTKSYVHVMDEQTTRVFQATDQRLQLAQHALDTLRVSGQLSTTTANAMLTRQLAGQTELAGLWVLDAQGNILYDTQPDTLGRSLADRRFFQFHLGTADSRLYIDTPVLSQRTGRWQLSVSRPLRAASGKLDGVIVAALEPAFFEALWRTVDMGADGTVTLLRNDGTLLMQSPFHPDAVGTSFKQRPLFTEYLPLAPQGSFLHRSPIDGANRIAAYRSLPGANMVLVVSTSQAFLLQPWYPLLTIAVLVALVAAASLAMLFMSLGRAWLRRIAAEETALENERAWQAMFEHSPVAQLLQLPFSTIVKVNDKFLELSGYDRSELVGAIVNDLGLRVNDALGESFVETLKAQGHVETVEIHARRKDASQRLVLISSRAVTLNGTAHHLHSLVDITELRQAEEQAWIGQNALAAISQGVLIAGPDRKTISVNHAFETLTGYTSSELVGLSCSILQGPQTDAATVAQIRRALDARQPFSGELLNYRKDGTSFWNELFINPVVDRAGALSYFVGVLRDVSQRKAQRVQEQLTEQVFSQGHEGITVTDARGCIIRVNNAFTEITGYTEAEVLGKNPRILSSGLQNQDFYRTMWSEILGKGVWAGEVFNRRKNGDIYPEWLTVSVLRNPEGEVTHFLGNFNDLSREKAAASHIQRLSHFDPLTGLPNRTLLEDRTVQAISMVLRGNEPLSMLLVSIDHFATITDTLGHRVGDALLIEVGKRLSSSVRNQDTVSHLPGKEFVLVLPGTPPDGAAHMATELISSLAQPLQIDSHALDVTVSIGVASFPENGTSFDTLFKSVELALHLAQNSGHDNFKFYSERMYQEVLDHNNMVKALRLAPERNELQVLFQPLGDLQTGKISGMEALLRWHHPERGTIPPAQFIPIAEESGLIRGIGEWVLRQVCKDLRIWLDKGIDVPHVAVNVSPLQFHDADFVALAQAILAEYSISPQLIYLEITESALMEDADHCEAILRDLKNVGFRLSLDDFGTGYSSLSYLKRYPFDKVKIDQSFVRDIGTSQTDTVIVKVIISMAHGLGLKVIAEGVETEAQCEIMRSNVCDEVQGYFFSRPVDAAAVERLLVDGFHLPAHLLRFRKTQRTLLLVDDEPNVVASLKRLLRRDGYDILSANSGAEGLEVLSVNKVDVIISDQRMPGMTGVEFLRQAKTQYPDTVRIVLSGYTELQSVTDAINEGAVYRFLTKPWEDEQLREQITKAFEHKELLEQNRQLDIKIRATNQELVAANRHLGEVIQITQKQVEVDATSLAIVQEALQYVPTPVIGLDDEDVLIFANTAAEALFVGSGPLLGMEIVHVSPELAVALTKADARSTSEIVVDGKRHQVRWHAMGRHSRSKGKLITLARLETSP